MKKAAAAPARKLAVIMHRMLADGSPFTTQPAKGRARHRQRLRGGRLKVIL
jgi:hypothetical protein